MKTYTVILPPPNVTGTLHLGHALNNILQDILVRYKRLKGYDVLWQPGTDHAGIATQMVVERILEKEGISRHVLGREKFLERVWKWKEESGGMIHAQQKCLNLSLNWERSRFTMDDAASKAVLKAFVTLYKDGLIYRDKRLVNWDPKLQTAISDLEVVNQEVKGFFYYIRYVLEEDASQEIVIATTRPETLFGDVAIAVHPEDARYQHLIGKYVRLPLTDRTIPVIADDYSDPELGTGAVKITPAHDFNDFQVGLRHGLSPINILDERAHLNGNVPASYQGLYCEKARKKIIEDLGDLLIKTESTVQIIPHGDRSGVVIQPYLTDQWFVDAKTLSIPAIQAVERGETRFIPENWTKTYFEWLNNIQPWCVSRQLWWGHQIPAWYGPDQKIFVAETQEEAESQAIQFYGNVVPLTRDGDVLDTWFSSALWPFVTMGWPEDTEELRIPSQVLVTGFDIIFFWVARMMMMGLYFMKRVPFKDVYVHALVRDEAGHKMSKSKGNVIDPMELMKAYGTDALRFSLAILAIPGRDVKIGPARVEKYRNFITKIQNSARFLEMNGCAFSMNFDPLTCKHPLNRWIYNKVVTLSKDVSGHLEGYRFDLAAQSLYHFLWGTFCDIYIECLKPLSGDSEFQCMGAWVYQTFLKILYAFAPETAETLSHQPIKEWPSLQEIASEPLVEKWLSLITSIRSVKGILGISGGVKLGLFGTSMDSLHWPWIQVLARLTVFQEQDVTFIPIPIGEDVFHLYIGEHLDHEAISLLLSKKIEKLEKECEMLSQKISNDAYKKARRDNWDHDQEIFLLKEMELQNIKNLYHRF